MSASDPTTRVEYGQIERFPGYRFGDDGSIWSRMKIGRKLSGILYTETWHQLSPNVDSNGYRSVMLRCVEPWSFRRYRIHGLILEAFDGPCPAGMECRHLDGTRTNNRLGNLQWATRRENHADKRKHGTSHQGDRAPAAKLTWLKVAEIRRLHAVGHTNAALGRQFDVTSSNIYMIVHNQTWVINP